MYHRHEMPFGANVLKDGTVRFGLWSPGSESVSLRLLRPQGDLVLPMQRGENGWFTIITDQAGKGSLYYYDFGEGRMYPDPASRRQPEGIHGPSEVIVPTAYQWKDLSWRGRHWREAVIYELHVGTFTAHGNYGGVRRRLDYLQKLGVTALEIMPLAQGPGTRSWGYDGVYHYAPDTCYGTPDDLKLLVDTAHERGMMVLLDVVYNHFGPEGNYLGLYAKDFFTTKHKTPWGDAINFDQENSGPVREFYWHNALYWLEEFRFDGLRCDAVHAIVDDSPTHIFEEIAIRVGDLARREDRHIHIIDENENNIARLLERDADNRPIRFTAQWNDDFHHSMHVILTGEKDAYYVDYADNPYNGVARCLAEGYTYQGESSAFRHGKVRGENSAHIPVSAFVNFLQNHDQVGNRPMGDRLSSLTEERKMRAAVAVLLLSPPIPLIFMGEEWASSQTFPYFCDFGPELSKIIRESRIEEFAIGAKFEGNEAAIATIPDPTNPTTIASAVLDWSVLEVEPHRTWLAWYRKLLAIRSIEIVPLIDRLETSGTYRVDGTFIDVTWPTRDGKVLHLRANLGDQAWPLPDGYSQTRIIFTTNDVLVPDRLDPWTVVMTLDTSS